jgi:hypothetical protein
MKRIPPILFVLLIVACALGQSGEIGPLSDPNFTPVDPSDVDPPLIDSEFLWFEPLNLPAILLVCIFGSLVGTWAGVTWKRHFN